LIQIALAFNYYEPVRATLELSQHLLQAIPIGGSPLLQLPGITKEMVGSLKLRQPPITDIRTLLALNEKEQQEALTSLDAQAFTQAIHIAKQIPQIVVTKVQFKGKFPPALALRAVAGDKIVTPSAIVELVYTVHLANQEDDSQAPLADGNASSSPAEDSDVDEDDLDNITGRKKLNNDSDSTPIPLVHAPYFPSVPPQPASQLILLGTQTSLVRVPQRPTRESNHRPSNINH
jgi:translocation protein SEC63